MAIKLSFADFKSGYWNSQVNPNFAEDSLWKTFFFFPSLLEYLLWKYHLSLFIQIMPYILIFLFRYHYSVYMQSIINLKNRKDELVSNLIIILCNFLQKDSFSIYLSSKRKDLVLVCYWNYRYPGCTTRTSVPLQPTRPHHHHRHHQHHPSYKKNRPTKRKPSW